MKFTDPYQRPGGKWLYGAAAQNARLKDLGGVEAYGQQREMAGYRTCMEDCKELFEDVRCQMDYLRTEVERLKARTV